MNTLTRSAALAALALAACASPSAYGETQPDAPDSEHLELVFSDDFDGNELDAVWSTCYWWQTDGGCTIASNDELEWYRPEAVTVEDGSAVLTATADEQTTSDGESLPYRSGLISTGHEDHHDVDEPGFAFTYGYVEARIRFPAGDGLWPAVWLLSADRTSLPEIDLLEWYGSRPTVVTHHVHQRIDDERASERIAVDIDDPSGEWHEVAVAWDEDRVEFFFDGVSTGVVDDPDLIPSTPMYLIVNLALGGPAGEVDADALPQSLLVDWVRVWR